MISLTQYAGPHAGSPDWTPACQTRAIALLTTIDMLWSVLEAAGVNFQVNPQTGSQVSGQTFGGFRPQSCPIGASNSAHKTGEAVDIYDPNGEIDGYLMLHQDLLETYGIYIEHPSATTGWSHWSTRAPGSGHHVFYP